MVDAVPDVRTARDDTVGSALAVETLHVVGHVVQDGQVVLHHDDVFIGGDHVAVYLAPLLLAAVHEVPETPSRHMVQAAAKRCSSLQNHGANDSIRRAPVQEDEEEAPVETGRACQREGDKF